MGKSVPFAEGVKISWRREIEIGDPGRIIRLACFTIYFGLIHVICFVIPNNFIALGKYLTKDNKQQY